MKISRLILLAVTILLSSYLAIAKRGPNYDSLKVAVKQYTKEDTKKVDLLLALTKDIYREDVKEGVQWAKESYKIASGLRYKLGLQQSAYFLSACYYYQGMYGYSLEYALEMAKYATERNDTEAISDSNNAIGLNYLARGERDKALEYLHKAKEYAQYKGRTYTKITGNIATIYVEMGKDREAKAAFEEVLAIVRAKKSENDIAINEHNLSYIYYKEGNIQKALELLYHSRKLYEKINRTIPESYYYEADYLSAIGKESEVLEQALWNGLKIAKKLSEKPDELEGYRRLYDFYKEEGEHQQALRAHEKYLALKDSLFDEEKERYIGKLQTQFEMEKKEQENKANEQLLKEQDRIIAFQNRIRDIGLGILLVITGLLVYSYWINVQRRKGNNLLREQKKDLLVQGKELSQQAEEMKRLNGEVIAQRDYVRKNNAHLKEVNGKLTDSIQAASVIQKGLLPFDGRMAKLGSDFFTIYNPKDIVSGDLYWLSQKHRIVAVVDCTGHSVTGAFMATLAYSMLNQVVDVMGITEPSEILKNVDEQVKLAVDATEGVNHDASMDMMICTLEDEGNDITKIRFAGAKRPLYYVKQGFFLRVKGSRFSVGDHIKKGEKVFETHKIYLKKGDAFYMGTDGFVDTANRERKRFGSMRYEALLADLKEYPMEKQKEILWQTLQAYRQGEPYRDDITVVGITV
ncbi:SpoIIE family protein phosphatase [Algivirga pacifica]|uniref:PPM-type phosphatase domain-containing protein n=1 Tax=Algivirga pacifica TaxID=1162670 RepID=A0ABP9DKF7_9BACT